MAPDSKIATLTANGLAEAVVAHAGHARPRGRGARVAGMTKYEYATVPLIVHATKQILDQWGEDGWELVQVLVNPDSGGLVAYLKRPLA